MALPHLNRCLLPHNIQEPPDQSVKVPRGRSYFSLLCRLFDKQDAENDTLRLLHRTYIDMTRHGMNAKEIWQSNFPPSPGPCTFRAFEAFICFFAIRPQIPSLASSLTCGTLHKCRKRHYKIPAKLKPCCDTRAICLLDCFTCFHFICGSYRPHPAIAAPLHPSIICSPTPTIVFFL